jgi:uncharacterized protein
MSLSVKTLDCNGFCGNCYESIIRKVCGNNQNNLDIAKMIRVFREAEKLPANQRKRAPAIHGGEPLLLSLSDLESLFKEIYRIWGRTSIQTNGILLSQAHFDLFCTYKTSVGISIEGVTAQANRGRWNASTLSDSDIQ